MPGLAKKLFLEKKGLAKGPWKETKRKAPSWPLLEEMVQEKRLGHVDIALAERLLRFIPQSSTPQASPSTPQAHEGIAALICHLSLASRQGHLCAHISAKEIAPPLEAVWQPSTDKSEEVCQKLDPQKANALMQLILKGIETIPSFLLQDMTSEQAPVTPICKQIERYYLQRYWLLETKFLSALSCLLSHTISSLHPDFSFIETEVETLLKQKALLPEQAKAINNSCRHPLSIICGGPGTGKTHTAGILLRTFWQSLAPAEQAKCRIALAAPTGKAAATLESSIRRALKSVEGFPLPSAQTLHTLLGLGKRNRQGADLVLPYDILLVDESSMIDAKVMGELLAAIKPGARLILLGDRHQLPPVEAGSLFTDLVTLLHKQLPQGITELKTCLRAELRAIVDVASLINQGEKQRTQALFDSMPKESGIALIPFDTSFSDTKLQQKLIAYGGAKFPSITSLQNPLEALHAFSQFCILTPFRKGALGVETLNANFLHMAMKQAKSIHAPFFAAPIMITKNDPQHQLFNGEIGLLIRPTLNLNPHQPVGSFQHSFALFATKKTNEEEAGVTRIPALMLPQYEYAYCLSVHKSQGSEFSHVVMLLPEGSEHFGRQVLYTGITRAKKALEIWASLETFHKTIEHTSFRNSGVNDRTCKI